MRSHNTFLLDYVRFKEEAQPYIEYCDGGNYHAVVRRAMDIAEDTTPKKWILEGYGTSIKPFKHVSPSYLRQIGGELYLVGAAFLVILSRYLRPFHVLPSGGLSDWLTMLEWDANDIQLVSNGMWLPSLLKPELVDDPLKLPDTHDVRVWMEPANYWWQFRPSRAYYVGWWTTDQIDRLYPRLTEARDEFLRANADTFDTPTDHLDLESLHAREEFLHYFNLTLEIYQAALKENVGLLRIVA